MYNLKTIVAVRNGRNKSHSNKENRRCSRGFKKTTVENTENRYLHNNLGIQQTLYDQ